MKTHRTFRFLVNALALLLCMTSITGLSAEEIPSVPKGKILLIVLDVSGSMKPFFDTVTSVLKEELVDRLIEPGDYFALMKFGDEAQVGYSGQIFRKADVPVAGRYILEMKADNGYTDIGSALKNSLELIVSLKNESFDKYAPLVLFVTDGNHTPQATSAFNGKNMAEIFSDPFIGDKNLYEGWYFLGIGKNLQDVKEIADLAGRGDYFLNITDIAGLEYAMRDWLSRIPPRKTLEKGTVNVSIAGIKNVQLKQDKTAVVPVAAEFPLKFQLQSGYATMPVNAEITSLQLSFQSADKKVFVESRPAHEKGRIAVPASGIAMTEAVWTDIPADMHGEGILKVDIGYTQNYLAEKAQYEYRVKFLTPAELFRERWLFPLLAVVALVMLILAGLFAKQFLPVELRMEVLGATLSAGKRIKSVKLAVGGKADFGTKAGLPFKLDGTYGSVIGSVRRTGKKTWKIEVRDSTAFFEPDKLEPYALNSVVRIQDRDGVAKSIRFTDRARKHK